MLFRAKEVIMRFIRRIIVSFEFFADLPQLERLKARTLRHDSNNVLTNQRKRFIDIRYTDFNIPVGY